MDEFVAKPVEPVVPYHTTQCRLDRGRRVSRDCAEVL
jgi:hypothetical protein